MVGRNVVGSVVEEWLAEELSELGFKGLMGFHSLATPRTSFFWQGASPFCHSGPGEIREASHPACQGRNLTISVTN